MRFWSSERVRGPFAARHCALLVASTLLQTSVPGLAASRLLDIEKRSPWQVYKIDRPVEEVRSCLLEQFSFSVSKFRQGYAFYQDSSDWFLIYIFEDSGSTRAENYSRFKIQSRLGRISLEKCMPAPGASGGAD